MACTPTLDFRQCRDDTDCVNEQGVQLVCNSANECVLPPDPANMTCESTTDCVEAFDSGYVCGPENRCAALASERCTIVQPPAGAAPEDIVWIGSILATSPPFNTLIQPLQNATQLAIEDFNNTTALRDGRKIGWVGCDSRGDADAAVEAARHLVDEVGVPALVGPSFSESTLAVAEDVTIPGRTFLITPTATNPAVTQLDDDGLVWRTITSDVHQAEAIADRLPLLDPSPERILVLGKDDAYGRGLASDVVGLAKERLPQAAVASLVYEDPATFQSNDELLSSYGATIGTGFQHGADTVVLVGTSETRELILFYLQARESANPQPPLERYLVSHGGVPVLESIVEAVAPEFRPTLMPQLEGTSPIIQDPQNFAAYNIRYKIRFDDQEALTSSSLSYDATMVVMLAMTAVPEGTPLNGIEIARVMPRLVEKSGTAVSFGGESLQFIAAARDALVAGGDVDLQGVSGALDFDLVTGEVRTDLIGWGLVPQDGTTDVPVLTPMRRYVLDDAPAVGGTWMDL
jgi:branched-chain amino acid transport system substrate-binding protein